MINTKKIFDHLLAAALVTLLFLPAGSCVEDFSYDSGAGTGAPGKSVPLRFSASVSGAGETSPPPVESKGVNPINPENLGNSNLGFMGMIIQQSPGGGDVFPGSRELLVKAFQILDDTQWVYYPQTPGVTGPVTPQCYAGKTIRVTYYGPVDGKSLPVGIGIDGFPFDFRGNLNNVTQQDYLYCDTTYVVPSNEKQVSLRLKHAFAHIRINVTKSLDKDTHTLSQVALDNMGDVWIKRKGYIDPATGDTVSGAAHPGLRSQAGPLSYSGLNVALSSTTKQTYDFFVPAFMSDTLKDETVVIALTINGKKKIFPLRRNHLNHEARNGKDYYGFAQGYINTYDVVYDNTAMRLILTDWNTVNRDGDFGIPPSGVKGIRLNGARDMISNFTWGNFPTTGYVTPAHLYESWLSTVALGNNGMYIDGSKKHTSKYSGWGTFEGDKNVYQDEPPSADFFMTQENVSTIPVPWEGADGALIAKELCRKYRGGGFTNWRLPRASEFRMVVASYTMTLNTVWNNLNFGSSLDTETFWMATEASPTTAWTAFGRESDDPPLRRVYLDARDKKTTLASVRCVRDN
ncbi:fimbrillin family protein [Coprobacter tertius]|uniref:Fimbrillin family protein n=1 Tax=Coprobacter tertius TaxID=2944915 RepID=A0ABT1MG94_9BACT|nr:fimbrillin family protein [Coprobacter tertius]MCP9611384.1 fimbrillin family protein [Coprobacter tertius]